MDRIELGKSKQQSSNFNGSCGISEVEWRIWPTSTSRFDVRKKKENKAKTADDFGKGNERTTIDYILVPKDEWIECF